MRVRFFALYRPLVHNAPPWTAFFCSEKYADADTRSELITHFDPSIETQVVAETSLTFGALTTYLRHIAAKESQ